MDRFFTKLFNRKDFPVRYKPATATTQIGVRFFFSSLVGGGHKTSRPSWQTISLPEVESCCMSAAGPPSVDILILFELVVGFQIIKDTVVSFFTLSKKTKDFSIKISFTILKICGYQVTDGIIFFCPIAGTYHY